jgi:hypothetical protein
LSLVGQYLKRFAQIDQIIDPRFPISGQGGIATSSLLKAYVGLLRTGKSDFDAIESLRRDAFFRDALGLVAVPSSPTLRQRMDALADSGDTALTALDEANERLLRRAKPAFTPLSTGHLALDFDGFTLDNSGTAKEGVGRTYMVSVQPPHPNRSRIYGNATFSGSNSSIRLLGQTGNFSRVSFSQA